MKKGRPNPNLFACGLEGLPEYFHFKQYRYKLRKLFKHDFFAATGLYEIESDSSPLLSEIPVKIVLKINRRQPLMGLPLAWLGNMMRNHEVMILRSVEGIKQVPQLLGLYEPCGFFYTYIEGCSLDESPNIPDSFFDECKSLLEQVHQRDIAYIDMNKRGNILIGQDNKPYLIDFQISLRFERYAHGLMKVLQKEDMYHLYKHKRRLRGDLLSETEQQISRRKSPFIRIHRLIATPFRTVRRRVLGWLVRRGSLPVDPNTNYSPENDLSRYDHSGKH